MTMVFKKDNKSPSNQISRSIIKNTIFHNLSAKRKGNVLHNWEKLGSKALSQALKGKIKDNLSLIRHLVQGEKVRSQLLKTIPSFEKSVETLEEESLWTGIETLRHNLIQDLSNLPLNELCRISVPKEYRESFEEVVIEAWRNKIAKESPQMLNCENLNFAMGSFKGLIGALSLNITVKAMNFENCNMNEKHMKYLATIINIHPAITSLHLNHNNIGDKGLALISQALRDNTILGSLSLKHNNITSDSLEELSSVLLRNRSLRSIDLTGNHIDEKGRKILDKVSGDIHCTIFLDPIIK